MKTIDLSDQEIIAEAQKLLSKWRLHRWIIFSLGIFFLLAIIAIINGYGVPYLNGMPSGLYGAIFFGFAGGFCHAYLINNWHGPRALRLLSELIVHHKLSTNGT